MPVHAQIASDLSGTGGFHTISCEEFWTLIDVSHRTIRLFGMGVAGVIGDLIPSPCQAKWHAVVFEDFDKKTEIWWALNSRLRA